MADEDMKNILTDLQLQELFPIFEKHKISKNVLKELSEEMIAELIPAIGLRATFLSYWKKTFKTHPLRSVENDVPLLKKSKTDDNEGYCGHLENEQNSYPDFNSYAFGIRSVRDILQESVPGQRIIKAYDRQKELSEKTRNKICDMIITDIENRFARLTNDTTEKIATVIVADFPTEVASTYYIPPIKKKDTVLKKSIPARGKLLNMWRNRTLATRQLDIIMQTDVIKDSDNDTNEDFEVQDSIHWLQNNQVPWELVLQHWRKTFHTRRINIEKEKENTLLDVFTKWPILKHPNGHSLIIEDFKDMSLSVETLTSDTWEAFFQRVISCVKPASKDDQLHVLMEILQAANINDDSKVALQLMILPHLMSPKKMTRCDKKFWKPSIWNAKDSIIKHVVIPGDVTRVRTENVKKCKELKLTIQPYIIVVGPSLSEINTSYVCIDDILYSTSSTVEAVDVCFKTFHVLELNYPTASEHLWLIIQKCVYKFVTKWDTIIPSTEHIIKTLNINIQPSVSTSK